MIKYFLSGCMHNLEKSRAIRGRGVNPKVGTLLLGKLQQMFFKEHLPLKACACARSHVSLGQI